MWGTVAWRRSVSVRNGSAGVIAMGVAALLGLNVLVVLYVGSVAERHGYKRGREDADNWWIRADLQSDRERQRIWREES